MNPLIELAVRLQTLGLAIPALIVVVKVTLIFLIARLLMAALPRLSAAARHLGITLALCGALAIPLFSLVIPAWNLAVLPAAQAAGTRLIGSTGDDQEEPTVLSTALTVATAAGVVAEEKITAMSRAVQLVRNSWQGWILMAVAGVSGAFLLRIALGVAGVGMVARRAVEIVDDGALLELDQARDHLRLGREVRLLRSPDIGVPVVWGLFRPILLLPAGSVEWSRERLRVVLLHELAHVKRWDGITLLMTKACSAIFWFHPLAWSLESAGRAECERACDDLVLTSGTKPSEYAEHLLSIARALPQHDPFRSVTLAMSRRSQLEGRLLSILEPRLRRAGFSARTVSATAAVALMLIVPLASVRLIASPDERSKEKEPVVEIGPAVAADTARLPEMLLAQVDQLKKKDRHDKEAKSGSEWYSRGSKLHNADRYPEAIAAFQQAVAYEYRVGASSYNIACGYSLLGDEQNALRWLEKAIEAGFDSYDHMMSDSDLDPLRRNPRFQQIVGHLPDAHEGKKDRFEEALQAYNELRGERSKDGEEWFEAGLDLLRMRQFDQSIDAFQQAIRLNEKVSTSMYNLACAYSLRGDAPAAIDWLQRAVENGFDSADKIQNDPDLRNIRNHPRFEEFVRLADDLKLRTEWQEKFWIFGDGGRGAWRDQLPHYREMTRKYPNMGRTWFNLGYAQLQAGENSASVESFRRAAELGYRPPTSMYNTACAYARAGNKDAAFEWLHKAHAAGFKMKGYLDDDNDLDSLRSDPRFRELRKQVRNEHDKDEVY